MSKPRFVVAEVSKNWPEIEGVPVLCEPGTKVPRFLAARFEQIINTNLSRGYRLHSWRMNRTWMPPDPGSEEPGQLNETIIAIFESVETEGASVSG